MSTKTTFKRIALVAVAALTGGLLSIVSTPAANAAGAQEIVSSMAVGTVPAFRAGVTSNVPVVLNLPSSVSTGDTIVVGVRLLTAPATSTYASVTANPTQSAYTGATNNGSTKQLAWATAASGSGSYGTLAQAYSTSGNATATAQYTLGGDDAAGQVTLRIAFIPDVSGAYSFLVSTPGSISASSVYTVYTASTSDLSTAFAISTGSAATAITLTATTAAPAALAAGVPGQIIKVSLGSTALGSGETLLVTTTGSATLGAVTTSGANSATSYTISSCSSSGCYFRVDNTVGENVTVTVTGSGTLSNAVTSSIGVTFTLSDATAPTATAAKGALDTSLVSATTSTTPTLSVANGVNAGTETATYLQSPTDGSAVLVAAITAAPGAAVKTHWTVTDTSGELTGTANAVYSVPVAWGATALAAAKVSKTFSGNLQRTGLSSNYSYEGFTATLNATVPQIIGVVASPAVASTLTVTNSNRRVAAASSNVLVAELDDQYGVGLANTSVTVTVAGRNGATASSTLVTDASGLVSYTLADVGTTGTSDVVTFTAGSITGSATLTYGTTTVTTLTIEGPNTDDTQITLSDKTGINAAKAGAAGTTATVTVTAKDANGVVMSGVPVTFSVAGTTAAILSTKVTQYTAADGTASTSVYAWATGSYVVTASAGGKTATDTVYFAQTTPTYARTISATVSGGTVTATVKDRYGNAVPNVTVWATKTGTGYFGSGSSSTSGTTNEAGTVDFYVNGSASVKVALGSSSAADTEYGQSSSAAGYVCQDAGCTTAAVTAATVGTSTTAESVRAYVGVV